MSKYRHANASRDAHIWSLRVIIGVLVVLCGALWHGWDTAPQDLTIHNPPDLRSGSTRKWWEVPPSSVYAFTLYVWQQINRWPSNGEVDFKSNLNAYQTYLTPSCQDFMAQQYAQRDQRNELDERVRGIYEIPGRGYNPDDVTVLDRNHWIVKLNLGINESLHGTPVRRLFIRYYMRVVRADVDPQHNPWGLQIDCFAKSPVRLTVPDQSTIDQDNASTATSDRETDSSEDAS